IVRPDGAIRWVAIQGRRYYRNSADGLRAVRSVGTVVDITHLKEPQSALRESEARLRIATNAAALGVFDRDVKADRMVWANDRAFEIFGHARRDRHLTGRKFLKDYVHPDDAKAVKRAMRNARREGGSHHVICRIHQKSGSQRWLQIDGRYELSDTGEPSRHIGGYHGAQSVGAGDEGTFRASCQPARGRAPAHCPRIARLHSAAPCRRQSQSYEPQS